MMGKRVPYTVVRLYSSNEFKLTIINIKQFMNKYVRIQPQIKIDFPTQNSEGGYERVYNNIQFSEFKALVVLLNVLIANK